MSVLEAVVVAGGCTAAGVSGLFVDFFIIFFNYLLKGYFQMMKY